MGYQKHTTHTDALDTLGSVITSEEKRDAIHLAVFPVESAGRMMPADHVKLVDGKAVRVGIGEGIGIVDPFLTDFIQPGDWFWLVVYPRQISSLRHVWEHDSFPPSGETEATLLTVDPELERLIAEEEQIVADRKAAAAKWIKNWLLGQELPYSYNQLIQALTTGQSEPDEEDTDPDDYYYHGTLYYDRSDGSLYSGGVDAYGTLSPEFWDNAEIVVGKPLRRSDYFSCSC